MELKFFGHPEFREEVFGKQISFESVMFLPILNLVSYADITLVREALWSSG